MEDGRASGPRRRPTMQDVAQEAGVSKGLVSMVLNGSSGPSATTRERVLAVAARLGYRGDRTAALLARRRPRTLGVTLIPGNLYHGELTEEIHSAAVAAGYEVVLSPTGGDEGHAVETLVDSRCEALLLLGPTLPAATLGRIVEGVPTVVLGRPVDLPDADVVRADDAGGLRRVAGHLAGLGHRRIAHVDGGSGAIAELRREAYLEAARRLGLDPLVLPGGVTEDEGAGALDALEPHDGVTALVAFNDRTAVGVLDRLERSGVRVPGGMSLTGFDDSPLARHARIDLTTVAQGYLEQAQVAVRLALERLEGGRTERREIVVPTRLVVRGSTGPPPS